MTHIGEILEKHAKELRAKKDTNPMYAVPAQKTTCGIQPRHKGEYTQMNDSEETLGKISLRDYFAAAALKAMTGLPSGHWTDNEKYWEGVARSCYICADAPLEARKKG